MQTSYLKVSGTYGNIDAKVENEVLIQKGKERSIDSSLEIVSEVKAPVKIGQRLGRLVYKLNEEIIAEYDVIAVEEVENINFLSAFISLINKFFAI